MPLARGVVVLFFIFKFNYFRFSVQSSLTPITEYNIRARYVSDHDRCHGCQLIKSRTRKERRNEGYLRF